MKFNSALIAAAALTAFSLSAAAHTVVYQGSLAGSNEAPPNASTATGSTSVTVDYDLMTMRVVVNFSNLLGVTTAAHIHCCTTDANSGNAGVASITPTFTEFPSGVSSGSYDFTFNMAVAESYNPDFIAAQGGTVSNAFNALAAGLDANKAYLNIHTDAFPGGEIRDFLTPGVIPVPAAGWLFGCGAVGLLALKRRNRLLPGY